MLSLTIEKKYNFVDIKISIALIKPFCEILKNLQTNIHKKILFDIVIKLVIVVIICS